MLCIVKIPQVQEQQGGVQTVGKMEEDDDFDEEEEDDNEEEYHDEKEYYEQ